MDQKTKLIAKVNPADRERILAATERVLRNELDGLDIKKLHGTVDTFRVRVGNFRIQYVVTSRGNVVQSVTQRNDHTYRF